MKHTFLIHAADMILLRAGLAIGVAMLGALAAVIIRGISHRTQCALISLAAGVLLGVGIIDLLPETRELVGLPIAILSLAFGALLFFLIGKYLYFTCPACSATAADEKKGFLQLGWLLIAAGALHALTDGIAITLGAEVSRKIGLLVLGAVAAHKLPEGMALAAIAMQAGYRRRNALLLTLAMELATAAGSSLGLLAAGIPGQWVGIALGVAGGSFLYIGAFALAAESKEHEKTSIAVWSIIGFLILAALSSLVPE